MALAPELGQAAVLSHPEPAGPAEKITVSAVQMEDLLKQYESTKLAGGEPGERSFVWPEGKRPDVLYNEYNFELPVIDLAPVLRLQSLQKEIEQLDVDGDDDAIRLRRSGLEAEIKACETAKSEIMKAMRDSCEGYGFFQIINSGFPMEVVNQFRECCRQIFDLPLEEKMEVKFRIIPGKSSVPGYTPMKHDLAVINLVNPAYTWSEKLDLESPEILNPGRLDEITGILRQGKPESRSEGLLLRSRTEEYGKQCSRVIYLVLDLIVSSLGIPEEAVTEYLGDREKQLTARIRVNNYPICENPKVTWGLQAHTDPDILTLLHQDGVGGLQIRFKDGTWHGVQPKAGAFIINCGDYLQAWTNGRFLSAEHRVVANEKARRMSIAYFTFGNTKYVISPRPECVDAEHPIRYRPFTAIEYMKMLMSTGFSQERGDLLEKAFGISTSC